MHKEIDILAFGAHADDVEIGMGGTIAKYCAKNKDIVICDLTQAEMSSNGTIHSRMDEARYSGEILGIKHRINAYLPDRGLYLREEYISRVASIIRMYKPKLVFAPYAIDRHPDHGNCTTIIEEACFSAGIRKYVDELDQQPHRVTTIYYYMINGFHKPDFVIDISEYITKKTDSLKAYKSQFEMQSGSIQTPLMKDYVESIVAREKMMGKEVGCLYAEGFFSKKPLLMNDLLGGE